jgi:DTW domain-containing protein YfiP
MRKPHDKHCQTCFKSHYLCVCEQIQPLDCETMISIIQYQEERDHPLNTGIIAHLSLKNSVLSHACPESFNPYTYLLYPGDAAVYLEDSKHLNIQELIVLDGTWKKTNKNIL